ncbi:MAG TPA: branched-chain amino acid ABC transporter substrate-binding protein [Anaerolineae bacterium]|nr:branched-chain amino acid ABC transporter substrate-binding protein [Anaerolineae bacterium]
MFARGRRSLCLTLLILAALWLPACGPTSGGPIKLYVSLPLQTRQGESIRKGIELAVNQAGGRVANFEIVLVARTDSLESGQWDADREQANAYEAVADPEVMAYIGPADSGAAFVSIPITNREGLAQISPSNTAPELTRAGFYPGRPGEFYPTGRRNYFRTCPTDAAQGPAAAIWARELGYRSVYVLDDGDVYGVSIANLFEEKALDVQIAVAGRASIDKTATDFGEVLNRVEQADPDLVFFGGTTENGAPLVVKQMREQGLRAHFMVPDGAADSTFIERAVGAAEGVLGTQIGEPPQALTTEVGAQFYQAYRVAYDEEPEPYAQFGYDAARVVLDAIRRAGVKDRRAILEAIANIRDFPGTGGAFRFDRNGDTTLTTISGNQVKDGKFVFLQPLIQH